MQNQQSIKDEYNHLANFYDKKWSGYLQSTHDVALGLIGDRQPKTILDACGGTGLFTGQLAEHFPPSTQITLIDLSEGMLHVAKNRFSEKSNVKIMLQDVHDLEFEPHSFSSVVSVSAFHYFNDPNQVLSEFHRVLESQGELILVDWCRDPLDFKLFDLFMRFTNRSHVKTHTLKELQQLLESAGFTIKETTKWRFGLWSLMGLRCTKT